MRYAHLYFALHCQPWLIMETFHGAMSEVLDRHIAGINTEFQPRETKVSSDLLPGASDFAQTTVDSNGIATISINGIIAKGASAFEKSCYGGVSPSDISQSLAAAVGDSAVRGVVLDFSSPGGSVAGVMETGNDIASVQEQGGKPIFAFTGDLMASAAYWMAAGSSRIYASPLATVGSIGVYVPVIDSSHRARMQGISVDVIKDGKHKAAGYPGTAMSEESRAHIQDEVNKIGAEFRDHVSKYRPRVARATMEGQTFLGKDAAENWLVDGIASSVEAVKQKMMQLIPATQ